MNRFKILINSEDVFEQVWRDRDSHLNKVEGFKNFNLIRGETYEDQPFMYPTVLGDQKKILLIGQNFTTKNTVFLKKFFLHRV